MAKATPVRAIPTLTDWNEAVDKVNYAKGTNIEVEKATKRFTPNKGAVPLFRYKNAKGNIGDWYAKTDVTEVVKEDKNGAVTVKQPAFDSAMLAKIKALQLAGIL